MVPGTLGRVADFDSMEITGSSQRFPVLRVYCLERNYSAHVIESGDDPDETSPFFFMTPSNAVTDYRDGFLYPPMTGALRYEGEMVVALASSVRISLQIGTPKSSILRQSAGV